MTHIETARGLLAVRGDLGSLMIPTDRDIEAAKAHALISIAESLAVLADREP